MWQVALAAAVAGSGILAKKLFLKNPPPTCASSNHLEREVFRFSSSGSRNGSSKKKTSRKKLEIGTRRSSSSSNGNGNGDLVEMKTGGLKKRRTSSSNCGPRSSKDGYGVGVGIMYMMMSAEINKFTSAMDQTAKVVEELKSELYKRKPQVPLFSNHLAVPAATEEPEVLEMNQLEAELQSELQKLSCCSTVASAPQGTTSHFCEETEFSDNDHYAIKEQNPSSNQCHGVTPIELDRKLSRLLIGQQESQIVELESELQSAHAKLHEKESELQALKDCVRRLTEFSLSSVSDNEVEVHMEQDMLNANHKMALESNKPMVGMKRANESC